MYNLYIVTNNSKLYFNTIISYLVQVDGFPSLVQNVSEAPAVDAALVEGHDVLGEGAGLVGEHVLDLAQLLVKGGGPRLGVGVGLDIVHFPVPVYQLGQEQSDDLHRH